MKPPPSPAREISYASSVIGRPLDPAALAAHAADARGMMDYLRAQTYRLSPTAIADFSYGFEFEDVR